MKTLQNNFTTPEQSKRLLELGVPVDSADCYRERYIYDDFVGEPAFSHPVFLAQPYNDECIKTRRHEYIPCWSVGRLNEIFKICSDIHIEIYDLDLEGTQIERAMQAFEDYAKDNWLDFSKLEE